MFCENTIRGWFMEFLRRLWRWLRLMRTAWKIRCEPSGSASQEAARRALAMQMADARGVPMKVGQMLAGMDDTSAFRDLTESIEPWPLSQMQERLTSAWGVPWQRHLRSIEESHAAASLGQVHKAWLHDGRCVAIKIQYPRMKEAMAVEMRLAGLLPGWGPAKRWHFDLDAYRRVLAKDVEQELDYVHEAEMQQHFFRLFDVPGLRVPEVVGELCRPTVLVQQWCEGERLAMARTWPLALRVQLARTLMMTLFQGLFVHGLVHGDPHPGNLLVSRKEDQARVTLLDFGCVVQVDETARRALLRLLLAQRGESSVDPLDAWVAMGFDADKLRYLDDALPALSAALLRPFREDRPFDVRDWRLGRTIADLLGERRWWFRSAGPAHLFLLLRAFHGLCCQIETLDVRLPWWPVLKLAVPEDIRSQAAAWRPPPVPGKKETKARADVARHLKVEVSRVEEQDIRMSMPASEAVRLREWIPADVREQLHREGVDIGALEREIRAQGLRPRELFSLRGSKGRYRVWLE